MSSRFLFSDGARMGRESLAAWLALTLGAMLFGLIAALLDRRTGDPNLAISVAASP